LIHKYIFFPSIYISISDYLKLVTAAAPERTIQVFHIVV